jgi:hypothetical protein
MEIKVERKVNEDGYSSYPYDQFVGFTKLDEIEWDNESYAFNITGIWVRDSDGTLWTADDSGCSCPTPWENLGSLERLFSIEALVERYKRQTATDETGYRYGSVNLTEWEAFKTTVEQAFADLAKR